MTAAVIAFSVARLFLRFLSVATLVMVGLFLFASPVSDAVLSDGRVPAADIDVGAPAPIVWIVFDELPTLSLMGDGDAVDRRPLPELRHPCRRRHLVPQQHHGRAEHAPGGAGAGHRPVPRAIRRPCRSPTSTPRASSPCSATPTT